MLRLTSRDRLPSLALLCRRRNSATLWRLPQVATGLRLDAPGFSQLDEGRCRTFSPLDGERESSWRPCAESLFPSRSFLAIGQTVGSLWLHLVLGQRIQKIFSPVPHRIDDRLQGLAALGNGIFHLRWNLS